MRRCRMLLWSVLLLMTVAALPQRFAGAEGPVTPVLLIHGFGASPEFTWGPAIPVFEEAGYRQGQTLFAIQLPGRAADPLELFAEVGQVRAEMDRIQRETGSAQIDLVGHSQGGLIARILSAGESSVLVRRAVSIDAPHEGILTDAAIDAMLKESGAPPYVRAFMPIPEHLRTGSPALTTMLVREKRFADQRSPALAIGSLWQAGALAVLDGHDGIVPLSSQLAWPGAQTRTFRLGPPPEVLASKPDPLAIAWQSPHALSQWDPGLMKEVIGFLQAEEVQPPSAPCGCPGFTDLAEHWAAETIAPYLPDRLPYTLAPDGRRFFEPGRPMTRAEFVYGLVRMKALPERLQSTPFTDLAGHWALGYAEAARSAGLVSGLAPDRFGPDQPLSRAQAATLVARALGLAPETGPGRFADTAGHWASPEIEAAAARGIVQGDSRGFRPDDPVTNAEGAVILIRAFGTRETP